MKEKKIRGKKREIKTKLRENKGQNKTSAFLSPHVVAASDCIDPLAKGFLFNHTFL